MVFYGTNKHNYHSNVNTQTILIIQKQFFLASCSHCLSLGSAAVSTDSSPWCLFGWGPVPHISNILLHWSLPEREREHYVRSQESSAFCHIFLFWHILVFCCSFISFYFKSLTYFKVMFLFWNISFVTQILFCLLILLHLRDIHAWHVLLTFSIISLTYSFNTWKRKQPKSWTAKKCVFNTQPNVLTFVPRSLPSFA